MHAHLPIQRRSDGLKIRKEGDGDLEARELGGGDGGEAGIVERAAGG